MNPIVIKPINFGFFSKQENKTVGIKMKVTQYIVDCTLKYFKSINEYNED